MIKHCRLIILVYWIYQLILGISFLFFISFFDVNDKIFLSFFCGTFFPTLIIFQIYSVIIRKHIPKESFIYRKYKGYRRTLKNEYEILFWKIKKEELNLIESNELVEVILSVTLLRRCFIAYFLAIIFLSVLVVMFTS